MNVIKKILKITEKNGKQLQFESIYMAMPSNTRHKHKKWLGDDNQYIRWLASLKSFFLELNVHAQREKAKTSLNLHFTFWYPALSISISLCLLALQSSTYMIIFVVVFSQSQRYLSSCHYTKFIKLRQRTKSQTIIMNFIFVRVSLIWFQYSNAFLSSIHMHWKFVHRYIILDSNGFIGLKEM